MEFKVGDKVRILDGTKQDGWNPRGLMKETIGMVGKITYIDRHDPKYRVTLEDDDWWDYNAEDLEIAEDLRELIKPCYVVVRRDGSICGIFATNGGLKLQTSLGSGMCFLEDYNKNLLKEESEIDSTDIMKIYGLSKYSFDISINNRHLIWERIEISPTQLKLEELEKKQREIADEMEKLRKEL